MRTESESIKAVHADHNNQPSARFPSGRVCEHEGCETKLSIYNKRPFCWQHDLPKPRPVPVRDKLR